MLQGINPEIQKLSFADPVKEIATQEFGMQEKDRRMLQIIGGTGRALNPNVWIDKLIEKIKKSKSYVIDDARYVNEIDALREKGFIIVYLQVDDAIRIQRLRSKYGKFANEHIDNMKDPSENQIKFNNVDLVWKNLFLEEVYSNIVKLYAQNCTPIKLYAQNC